MHWFNLLVVPTLPMILETQRGKTIIKKRKLMKGKEKSSLMS